MTNPATHPGDRPSVHGMVVLGQENVYLSHLPMFHTPHDYQVLLRVSLRPEDQGAYLEDRHHTGTLLYTIEPERFSLPDLAYPTPAAALRQTFRGTIYRDHFERGGVPILKDVPVQIDQVIHFRKFDAADPAPEHLTYLVFGTPTELFLAHYITRAPDFDELLAVTFPAHTFTAEVLQQGVLISFPERANGIDQRLGAFRELQGLVDGATTQVKTGDEFYFETGDLAH